MPYFLLGHVCGVWKFWPWRRGSSSGLCSVWPVLPSILCWHKGTFTTEFVHHTCIILSTEQKCHYVIHRPTYKCLIVTFTDHQGGPK